MVRNREQFVAVTNDGRSVIIVIEESTQHPDATELNEELPALKRAHTEVGEACLPLDDHTWHVPSMGIVRRR